LDDEAPQVGPYKKRKVTLDHIFLTSRRAQFDQIVEALQNGELVAEAYIYWIDVNKTTRYDDSKHQLRREDWMRCRLCVPEKRDPSKRVYLADDDGEQFYNDITLNTALVNRTLGLTTQGGGQSPKMTPRLYAFLSVWYSRSNFEADPKTLFSILEHRSDIWGSSGVIDGNRGLKAIEAFLSAQTEFEELFEAGKIGDDISIASTE
jgi:hypothetical protein